MADPTADARIRDLEQKLAAMPGSRAFVALADEYRRAGRLAEALTTLQAGLAVHPSYLSAQVAVARVYHEMRRGPEAIEAFNRVLAIDRENLVAAKSLAEIYQADGNRVEAIKKWKLYRALSGDKLADEAIAALEQQPAAAPPESEPEPVAEMAPAEVFPEVEEAAASPEPVREPGPEPVPPAPPVEAETPHVPDITELPVSKTLAELYYAQGYLEDARKMYEKLQENDPNDWTIARRVTDLRQRLAPRKPPMTGATGRARSIESLRRWLAAVQQRNA
jgi:tetratricopeptide (TPR) repeat protein